MRARIEPHPSGALDAPADSAVTEGVADGLLLERIGRQRALRAAVLIDAIRCLSGAPGTLEPGARRAAVQWILSHDARAPFSFRNVCESLGLDPARIRRALLTPLVGEERPRIAIRRRKRARSPRPSAERRPNGDRTRPTVLPGGPTP